MPIISFENHLFINLSEFLSVLFENIKCKIRNDYTYITITTSCYPTKFLDHLEDVLSETKQNVFEII